MTIFISEVLKENHLTVRDLTAISVSSGPGSYTGLRVSASIAKAMAVAINSPIIPISNLDYLAFELTKQYPDALIAPMIDARRMEVYTSLYRAGREIIEKHNMIVTDNSFVEYLEKDYILAVGNGALKTKAVISHTNYRFLPVFCSAKSMISFAYKEFLKGKIAKAENFVLNYFNNGRDELERTVLYFYFY